MPGLSAPEREKTAFLADTRRAPGLPAPSLYADIFHRLTAVLTERGYLAPALGRLLSEALFRILALCGAPSRSRPCFTAPPSTST